MTVYYEEEEGVVMDNHPTGVRLEDGDLKIDLDEIRPEKIREYRDAFETALETPAPKGGDT
jgi:hypothetical protein